MYTIYLDLDGTILDIAARYYRIHCDVCELVGATPLAAADYWEIKRGRRDVDALPGYLPEHLIASYHQERINRIEAPEYLTYDRLLPGAQPALTSLATRDRLVLVTLRRNPAAVHQQLRDLAIDFVFDQIIVGHAADEEPHWRAKARLIERDNQCGRLPAVVVGDTEADVLAGRSLGLATIAVLSGIRNRELLEALQPNRLLASIAQLPEELRLAEPESIPV